jgi:hypothetical protein
LNPHRAWRLIDGSPEVFIPGPVPWVCRQQSPKAYQLEAKSLLVGKLGAVWMRLERSQDIDEQIDFTIIEALVKDGVHE